MERDEDFYVFHFKTVWCPYNEDKHARDACVYAHNWQDFRRKPFFFSYTKEQCQNWESKNFIVAYSDGCKDEHRCRYSHGWKEQEYHPLNYKSKPCEDKKCNGNLECPYYHGNHDRRVVHQGNAQEMMRPKQRSQVEQLMDIGLQNLVISNVNHLKEFLFNQHLTGFNFYQLQQYFKELNLPPIVINYMEEKGVVPSDNMMKIRDSMQSMNIIVRPNMT